MPLTPEEIKAQTDRASAMLEQTKVEGNKPFAGSSFDINRTVKTETPETTGGSMVTKPEDIKPIVESTEEIQARKTKEAQAEIDALNKYYSGLIEEQKVKNVGEERKTSAISTLTGLAGSTEANIKAGETQALGDKAIQRIQEEKAVRIQSILSNIRTSAVEEARQLREEAREESEFNIENRRKTAEEAVNNAKYISASGVTIDGLKLSDPESYDYLSKSVGGEAVLKGIFTLNRPVESIIDKRVENGKYIIAYQNPIDGKTRIETVDLGIPNGYSKTIDAGDRILAIPDNWGGDPSELITINKGLTPAQKQEQQKAQATTGTDQLYSGLSSTTSTAVRSKVTKFSTEPIVQNFATIQEGYNFAKSLQTGTTNPADDQALIYSLAKALDPDSVVREGEYATAQKYSQSWIKAFGKGVSQAINGTGFLSKEARDNIKKTIEQKYNSSLKSYNNIQGQYEKSINNLTGRNDGKDFLVDYITPEPETKTTNVLISPDGTRYDSSDLTPEELQEALKSGYKQE